MALVNEENLPLVEPVPIEDELCSGLALIEDVAGVAARFVLYHTQTQASAYDRARNELQRPRRPRSVQVPSKARPRSAPVQQVAGSPHSQGPSFPPRRP